MDQKLEWACPITAGRESRPLLKYCMMLEMDLFHVWYGSVYVVRFGLFDKWEVVHIYDEACETSLPRPYVKLVVFIESAAH